MLTLLSVFGIMAGIFLYEYTDYFSVLTEERIDFSQAEFEITSFVPLCTAELKLMGLIFVSGFTLFNRAVVSSALVYKGFMTGFSTLYYGMQYRANAFETSDFIIISVTLIASVTVYVITGAKAMAYGGGLKYAAPDLSVILKQRVTREYILTFLLMTAFIVIITAIKYAVPYI